MYSVSRSPYRNNSIKVQSLYFLFLVCLLLFSIQARGQSISTFSYPTNGQMDVDTTIPFRWSATPNAQAYFLIVGSAPGGRDLVNSYEIQTTSYAVPALLQGRPLYARVSTKLNGKWKHSSITFQVANGRATFITPNPDGGERLFPKFSFKWTSTKGATGYSLKLGTAPGLRDIYDGGTLKTTETQIDLNVAMNTTLYASIYTRQNKKWVATHTSFLTPDKPVFIYPQDKEPSADTNTPFSWVGFPNVSKYFLKIGTKVGATDLYSSGETANTSANIPPLPTGRTLFARLQARFNNKWIVTDITFQVTNGKAVLLNPKDGSSNAPSNTPFQWSTMQGATLYVLNIGTKQGAKNLYNSGEINKSSVQTPVLPVETNLFARIWTKHKNGWAFSDSQFTLAPAPIRFLNPLSSNLYLLPGADIRWTTSASIDSYRLLLGSSVGGSDYLDTGEMVSGSYPCPVLPVGTPIYTRVLSHWQGAWYSTDTVLYAHSAFQYPQNGAMDVDTTKTFTWSPGATLNGVAPQYTLSIGTSITRTDVLAPTVVSETHYDLSGLSLPSNVPLYATLKTVLGDGSLRFATSVFSTSDTVAVPVSLVYPSDGEQAADVSNPFVWTESDLATGYRLEILSEDDVVRDSGVIRVPRYFASDLPVGDYTARLSVQLGGVWYVRSSSFHVSATGADVDKEMQTALWATDRVRKMGLGYAFQHTQLWTEVVNAQASFVPVCTQFAYALLALESQMNIGRAMDADKQPRKLIIAYIVNGFDGHTLTEYYHRGLGRWIVLDPTFGLVPLRASDGTYATKEDIQASTLKQDWNGIQYQFLGSYGDSYARGYYLDYPLLYLNVPNPNLVMTGSGNDPLPYLDTVNLPLQFYTQLLVTSPSNSVELLIDGTDRTIPTTGVKNTSPVFIAKEVRNPNSSIVNYYKVKRFRF